MSAPSQRELAAAGEVFEVEVYADNGDELWPYTSTYALDHGTALTEARALLVRSRQEVTENPGDGGEVTLTAYVTPGRMVNLSDDDEQLPDWTFEATPFAEVETVMEASS